MNFSNDTVGGDFNAHAMNAYLADLPSSIETSTRQPQAHASHSVTDRLVLAAGRAGLGDISQRHKNFLRQIHSLMRGVLTGALTVDSLNEEPTVLGMFRLISDLVRQTPNDAGSLLNTLYSSLQTWSSLIHGDRPKAHQILPYLSPLLAHPNARRFVQAAFQHQHYQIFQARQTPASEVNRVFDALERVFPLNFPLTLDSSLQVDEQARPLAAGLTPLYAQQISDASPRQIIPLDAESLDIYQPPSLKRKSPSNTLGNAASGDESRSTKKPNHSLLWSRQDFEKVQKLCKEIQKSLIENNRISGDAVSNLIKPIFASESTRGEVQKQYLANLIAAYGKLEAFEENWFAEFVKGVIPNTNSATNVDSYLPKSMTEKYLSKIIWENKELIEQKEHGADSIASRFVQLSLNFLAQIYVNGALNSENSDIVFRHLLKSASRNLRPVTQFNPDEIKKYLQNPDLSETEIAAFVIYSIPIEVKSKNIVKRFKAAQSIIAEKISLKDFLNNFTSHALLNDQELINAHLRLAAKKNSNLYEKISYNETRDFLETLQRFHNQGFFISTNTLYNRHSGPMKLNKVEKAIQALNKSTA